MLFSFSHIFLCFIYYIIPPFSRLEKILNRLLIRLAGIEEKYERQKKELENISSEILKAVALLDDNELETVLINRYLLLNTIEQTAELMHYSPETIRKKTNKAIKKLWVKLLEVGILM